MKLAANVTRFAPTLGFICDVETNKKATEEEYDFRFISPGYYLCITEEGNAYAISEYNGKIGCACADMTYNRKGKEICKHGDKFMRLKDLPTKPIDEEMIQLLEAAGWSGQKLTPPKIPEQRKRKKLPNIHDPARTPQPKAEERADRRKRYDSMTPAQIIAEMPDDELERNARRGAPMAIAELARREAKRAVSE